MSQNSNGLAVMSSNAMLSGGGSWSVVPASRSRNEAVTSHREQKQAGYL